MLRDTLHGSQTYRPISVPGYPGVMARPYKDAVEVATSPIEDARSPFTPPDARILLGIYTPGVRGPAPLVLLPEYEYRLSLTPVPGEDGEGEDPALVWVIERRIGAPPPPGSVRDRSDCEDDA